MPKQIRSLADFKRRAQPGARFLRTLPGTGSTRVITVAYVQSNAVVFPVGKATESEMQRLSGNPGSGSWFWFPKAARCSFKDGEMTVANDRGQPIIAFKPLD
jgi:hypothetical protein